MSSPWIARALLVAASVGCAAAGWPVIPLYRRIEKPDILRTEARRRVYERVAREPGLTAAEIALLEGFDRKTAQHHARLLHLHAFLEAERRGRSIRYFLPGDRGRRPPAEGVAADLLRLALRQPGLTQAEAAAALGVCRATVQWHVRKLAERGLLESGRLRVPAMQEERLREALTPSQPWPVT